MLEFRLGDAAFDQMSQRPGREQREMKAATQARGNIQGVTRAFRREISELGQPNAGLQRLDIVCHNPPIKLRRMPACPNADSCDLPAVTN